MNIKPWNLVNYVVETLVVLFIIYQIPPQPEPSPTKRREAHWASYLFLLVLLPFYVWDYNLFLNSLTRIPYRVLCYFGFILLNRRFSARKSLFYALLVTAVYLAHINLRTAPILYEFSQVPGRFFPVSRFGAELILFCIKNGLFLLIALAFAQLFPFEKMEDISQPEFVSLWVAVVSEFFIKESLYVINKTSQLSGMMCAVYSVYVFVFTFFALACVILMAQHIRGLRDRERLFLQESANEYRLQSLNVHQQSTQNFRQLVHDIRNHLTVIGQMAEESQSAQISEYVHSMIGSYTAPEKAFHTGNEILNGLLSMKYAQAVKSGVAFTSNLYLGPDIVPYLTDADVCAVFGNLLDNAIEAAELVPSAEDRFIQLRSQTQAHFLCIVITNSRAHIPVDQEGSLLTTKKNPEFHGIGLSKVRDVMSQYGGTLALDYHEPGLFRSTLLFPLKTTPPSAEEEVRK